MGRSFIKLLRAEDTFELLQDSNAFSLLTMVALRAKRTGGISLLDLKAGQALVGDLEKLGMTEGQYRAAKKRLERLGLATFMGTRKGTIATLSNDMIFDINIDSDNDQEDDLTTTTPRTNNNQTTTNKNFNKIKKIKKDHDRPPDFLGAESNSATISNLIREEWERLPENEKRSYVKAGLARGSSFLPHGCLEAPLTETARLLGFTEFGRQYRSRICAEKGGKQ